MGMTRQNRALLLDLDYALCMLYMSVLGGVIGRGVRYEAETSCRIVHFLWSQYGSLSNSNDTTKAARTG